VPTSWYFSPDSYFRMREIGMSRLLYGSDLATGGNALLQSTGVTGLAH
jgi:hypothetical protein